MSIGERPQDTMSIFVLWLAAYELMPVFMLSVGSFTSIGGHGLRLFLFWIEELFTSRLAEKSRPSLEKAIRGCV